MGSLAESKAILPDAASISTVIEGVEKKEAYRFFTAFCSKAEEQPGTGWSLLTQIFHYPFMASKPEPFGPMLQADEHQSQISADLSENELDAICGTLNTVADPEFRARVGDILWLQRRDFKAAHIAVAAYIESGSRLEDLEHWPACMERYERGLRLARQIDAKGRLSRTVLAHLEMRVRYYNGDDPSFFTSRVLKLLAEFRFGDFPALAGIAGRIAAKSCADNDFGRARTYFDVQAKLLKLSKDKAAEEAARVASSETYVQEAESHEVRRSFMSAHGFWEDAVRAFRERPSLRARIPEVQRYLAIAGKKMCDEMTSVTHEIDIRLMAEQAESAFKGLSLDDALCQLVIFGQPIDPVVIRELTLKQLEDAPLHAHIDADIYDETGRKIGRRPSISSSDENEREAAVQGFIEQNVFFSREIVATGSLMPAVQMILSEHDVSEKEIESFIADSRFIPKGRLPLFAKAIADGFRGDLSTALHIFVPQAENGLRYLIEQAGEVPRNVNQDGIEEVWSIERIFGNERLKKTLGAAFTFDLQSLLSGRTGPNLRNNIAHGLISSDSLNSSSGLYLWWLLLRLVVFPTSAMTAFFERRTIAREAEKG